MGKVVSCGVVMVNARREVFACHATGTPRWDLPKGVQDPGESAIQTALREVWEETSLARCRCALGDVRLVTGVMCLEVEARHNADERRVSESGPCASLLA